MQYYNNIYIKIGENLFMLQHKLLNNSIQNDRNKIHFLKGDLQQLFKECCHKFQQLQEIQNNSKNLQISSLYNNSNIQIIQSQNGIHVRKDFNIYKKNNKLTHPNTMHFQNLTQYKYVQPVLDKDAYSYNKRKFIKKDRTYGRQDREYQNQDYQKKENAQEMPFLIQESQRRRKTKNFIDFLSEQRNQMEGRHRWKCPVKKCGRVMSTQLKYLEHLDKCHNEFKFPEEQKQNFVTLKIDSQDQK